MNFRWKDRNKVEEDNLSADDTTKGLHMRR